MPLLKDLICSIELSERQQTLQEFGTVYSDGVVETFVPVPTRPQAFSVHLTSTKFIAPGLSIFVFIDGVYQCNRNRQGLELRAGSENRSSVDFQVRQKEEKQQDGSMIARQWTFGQLDTASADRAPNSCSPNLLENIGCIEVFVLRCIGSRDSKNTTHNNLDGAGDHYDRSFARDGQHRTSGIIPKQDDPKSFMENFGINYGPPPPMPFYQPPFVEPYQNTDDTTPNQRSIRMGRNPSPPAFDNHNSHYHSRYSESISPRERPRGNASYPGFHYGSGPVPSTAQPFAHHVPSGMPTNGLGVDPLWLGDLVQKAVKQGVEESQRIKMPLAAQPEQNEHPSEQNLRSQLPGAWPISPFSTPAELNQQFQQPSERITIIREEPHVTWEEGLVPESETNEEGWGSPKKMLGDAWDSDETWATEKPLEIKSRKHERHSRISFAHVRPYIQPVSRATSQTRTRRPSSNKSRRTISASQTQVPKWADNLRSSSEDDDSWTHVKATSDSTTSRDDFNQATHISRSKFEREYQRPSRSYGGEEQFFPSHISHHGSAYRSPPIYVDPAPSVITRITPKIMNAPPPSASAFDTRAHSRRPSAHIEPVVPVFNPINWGWNVPTKAKNTGQTSMSLPPVPYVPNQSFLVPNDSADNRHGNVSASSSAWGDDKKQKTNGNDAGDEGWKDASDTEWNVDKTKNIIPWAQGEETWENEKKNGACNVQWGANDTYTISAAVSTEPAKATSVSKRHTSKSLAKYRQHRQNSSHLVLKPQWQFPPAPPTKPASPVANGPDRLTARNIALKERLHAFSKETADQNRTEHKITPEKGMQYGHAIGRPKYLDEFDKPYAVFRFKYRSRGKLKSILGDEIPNHGPLTIATPQSTTAKAKEKLLDLPQNELVEKMLKLQTRLAEHKHARRDSSGAHVQKKDKERYRRQSDAQQTDLIAKELTENWVERQSRDPSRKSLSQGNFEALNESKAKTEDNQGWGRDGWGDGDKESNTKW